MMKEKSASRSDKVHGADRSKVFILTTVVATMGLVALFGWGIYAAQQGQGQQQHLPLIAAEQTRVRGGGAFVRIPNLIPGGERVTLEEARRRIAFEIRQPTYLLPGTTLSFIAVSPETMERQYQQIAFAYSNGLRIYQRPEPNPPTWEDLAELPPPHERIRVNGAPGTGHEPGITEHAMGGPVHNPGGVGWFVDGMVFQVIGDMPLEELLRIAESLR